MSSFAVSTSDFIEEQSSIGKGRAVEEIRNSNAKQSLSCDKLVGHVHTISSTDGTLHVVRWSTWARS